MGYSGRGYPPPKSYLFIDGGYFRKYLEYLSTTYFIGKKIEFNYSDLKSGYEKVFYYDCLPAKKSKETKVDYDNRIKAQKDFFNGLKMIDGFHVYLGSMSGTDGKARQKQVDIMIAVHMLSHTIRGNMERTTLIAGDLDFKPLIDVLVQEGMYVTLWYDHKSASKELIYSADARKVFYIDFIVANSNIGHSVNYKIPERKYDLSSLTLKDTRVLKSGYAANAEDLKILYHEVKKDYIVTYRHPDDNHLISYRHKELDHLERFLSDNNIRVEFCLESPK